MPVKSVYFQPGHFINIRLECFNRPEMAACVMHEAPDGERGAVLDVAAWVISPGSQLVQRSAGIKNTRIVSGRNQNAVGADPQFIPFLAQRLGQGRVFFTETGAFLGHVPVFQSTWDGKGISGTGAAFSCWRGCGDAQSPWEEVKQSIRPEASKGAERDNRMANITRG